MPSSHSVCNNTLARCIFCLLYVLIVPGSGSAQAQDEGYSWLWQPWVGTSGGYESDLILDPDLTRQVVPGGAFLELSPGFRLSKPLSRNTSFRLLNRNTVERFFNSENRTLFASSLFGDFRFKGQSPFRARTTLNGDYFNDSGSSSFRRWSGGADIGVGVQFKRWAFEVSGNLQGRSYPNVQVLTESLETETYTESHRGLGGYLVWNPLGQLFLRGAYNRRNTDSVDPAFVSTSYTASASLEYLVAKSTWITANVTGQSREFSNRLPDEDEDSYVQFGIGVNREINPNVNLFLRYAQANYTYPLGAEQATNRIAAGITWQFGKNSPPIQRQTTYPFSPNREMIIEGNPAPFRIYAPGAKSVAVVGSFNNWNPTANPLLMSENGWWESGVALNPGVYEYLYLVDGELVVPPEAERTTDDGFGGRNGIMEIIPAPR